MCYLCIHAEHTHTHHHNNAMSLSRGLFLIKIASILWAFIFCFIRPFIVVSFSSFSSFYSHIIIVIHKIDRLLSSFCFCCLSKPQSICCSFLSLCVCVATVAVTVTQTLHEQQNAKRIKNYTQFGDVFFCLRLSFGKY